MTAITDAFVKQCRVRLRFLEDEYECQVAGVEQDAHGAAVTDKNATTGIEISLEPRENRVWVSLIWLIGGEIPAYLDAPDRWLYLDRLIAVRAPSAQVDQKPSGDRLTPDGLSTLLEQYARALRDHAGDILRGDFSVLPLVSAPESPDLPLTGHIDALADAASPTAFGRNRQVPMSASPRNLRRPMSASPTEDQSDID